jgi:hypothetical protein
MPQSQTWRLPARIALAVSTRAKGWNLIQRFSEDIDLFLDPLAFQPALGKNAINRELRNLRDLVWPPILPSRLSSRRVRP